MGGVVCSTSDAAKIMVLHGNTAPFLYHLLYALSINLAVGDLFYKKNLNGFTI